MELKLKMNSNLPNKYKQILQIELKQKIHIVKLLELMNFRYIFLIWIT